MRKPRSMARTQKPPKDDRLEDAVHVDIRQFLELILPPGSMVFHIPNETSLPVQWIMKLLRLGMRPGAADLGIVVDGRIYWIEVKRGEGNGSQQSSNQKDFERDAIASGAKYAVCRSKEEALEAVKSWGIKVRAKAIS